MIVYHHIGGRSGTFPVPVKGVSFAEDIHLVLYEADADCVPQIIKAEKGTFGKVTVHPYCIGEKTIQGALNINFHPPTNSLYPFNEAFADYTRVSNPIYGEYRLGDACRFVRSVPIQLFSLEDALKEAQIEEMDFLSLDVQGAEYDILKGAQSFIQQHCVGVQLEVEFVKIYQGQKSFFEINQLMESMEFELVELDSFGRCAPLSMPIGFRGLEQPVYGEAVYVKKWEAVLREANIDKMYKWALFCLINKKIGLCIKALIALATLTNDFTVVSGKKPTYVLLLEKILTLYRTEGVCRLPSLSELFSQDILSGFYRGIPNDAAVFVNAQREIQDSLRDRYMQSVCVAQQLQQLQETPFEQLLKDSGLSDIAEIVKVQRTQEAAHFLQLVTSIGEKNTVLL